MSTYQPGTEFPVDADPADAEPTKHDKGELDTPSEHARAVSDLVFMRLEFHLCAINRWTGELAWSHSPSFFGGKSVSTFIRAGDRLFVLGNGFCMAMNAMSGRTIWEASGLKSGFAQSRGSLMLDGDRLIASLCGYLTALDPETGDVLWKNNLKGFGEGHSELVSGRDPNAPCGSSGTTGLI